MKGNVVSYDILYNIMVKFLIINLYQGVRHKYDKLLQVISEYNDKYSSNYALTDCAYIGDDILDLQCMEPIRVAGGIIGCPKDAVLKVKSIAHYVSEYNGGNGAVRDFIEWIIHENALIEK